MFFFGSEKYVCFYEKRPINPKKHNSIPSYRNRGRNFGKELEPNNEKKVQCHILLEMIFLCNAFEIADVDAAAWPLLSPPVAFVASDASAAFC